MVISCAMADRSVTYGRKVYTLFVDNLPSNLSNVGLKQIFKGVGDIADVVVSKKVRVSKIGSFGFVRFWDESVANRAIEKTNGRSIDGRRILVKWARFERREKNMKNLDRKMSKLQEIKGVNVSGGSNRSFADALISKVGGMSSSMKEAGYSPNKVVVPGVGLEGLNDGSLVLDWFHNLKSRGCLEAKFKFLIEGRVVEAHLVDQGPIEEFRGKGEVVVKGVGVDDSSGEITHDCSKGNSELVSNSGSDRGLIRGGVREDDPVVSAMLAVKTNSQESLFTESDWVGKLVFGKIDGSWGIANDTVGNMDGQVSEDSMMKNGEEVGRCEDSSDSNLALNRMSGRSAQEGQKSNLGLSKCGLAMGEVKGLESPIFGPVEELSLNKGVNTLQDKTPCDDNFSSSPCYNLLINDTEALNAKRIKENEVVKETQQNCQTVKDRQVLEYEESIMREEYLEILNRKNEVTSGKVVTTRKSTRKRVPRIFHVGPRVVVI